MPDDKDLTRALNFIVRVQPESAEAYARDMEDLNKRREQLHAQSEKRVSTATTEESEKRFKAAKSDLDKLEDETVSKYDKEMERLAKLRVANEEKYSDVVKLAREAARQEKDISDTLITDEERRRYEQYTKNAALIEKRKADAEQADQQESLSKVTKSPFTPVAAEFAKGVGVDAGGIGEIIGNLANPMLLVANIAKDLAVLIREGVEDARKRDREMISILSASSAGFNLSKGMSFLDMEALQGRLETSVPSEQRGQVGPALQRMVTSTPGTTEMPIEKVQARFEMLINTADRLNMGWAEAAQKIGDTARKAGESFEQTSMVMLEANAAFQRRMQETGQTFDLTKLRQNFLDLYDSMRIYNGSLTGAAIFVEKFANELDKGILTIGDLVQMTTGMSKADEGQRAFMMDQFIKENRGGGGERGQAAERLSAMTGNNPVAMAEAMKRMVEGDDQEKASMAARLGISASGMRGMMVDFGMNFSRQEAQRITGSNNDLINDPIMRQLREQMGLERSGMTFEQDRALDRGRTANVPQLSQFGDRAAADMSSVSTLRDASRALLEPTISALKQGFNETVQGIREMVNGTGSKLDAINKSVQNSKPVTINTNGASVNVNESSTGTHVDVDATVSAHSRHMTKRAHEQSANSGI
jgi:hypothetical protein